MPRATARRQGTWQLGLLVIASSGGPATRPRTVTQQAAAPLLRRGHDRGRAPADRNALHVAYVARLRDLPEGRGDDHDRRGQIGQGARLERRHGAAHLCGKRRYVPAQSVKVSHRAH